MGNRTLWLMIIVAACSSITDPQVPNHDPVFEGSVSDHDVTEFGHVPPNVYAIQPPDVDCGAVLQFDRGPTIYQRDPDGKLHEASIEDLIIGRTVNVWINPDEDVEDVCPWTLSPIVIVVE